jgi:hypothetical protein
MKGFADKDLAGAREAAGSFLRAVVAGKEGAARELLILGEGESLDFKSMSSSIASFELGDAKAEADHVVVVAAIKPKAGQDAPPALPLVMARAGGPWKVDMGASIQKLMGGLDLQALMEKMAQGLGDAMAQGMEGLGDALAQGMGAAAGDAPAPKKARKGPVAKRTPAKKKPR